MSFDALLTEAIADIGLLTHLIGGILVIKVIPIIG